MHLSKISLALRQWGNVDPNAAIKALFANGEQGAWYDPSDLTTMFQDRAGTIQVTADGQTVGKILDKSGRGNHAVAPNDSARPLYKERINLLSYSEDIAAEFSLGNVTITPNVVMAPNGTMTADQIVEGTNSNSFFSVYQPSSVPMDVASYTVSIWAKPNGRNYLILYTYGNEDGYYGKYFELIGSGAVLGDYYGAPTNATITLFPNGWYLCTMTVPKSPANSDVSFEMYLSPDGLTDIYNGDGVSGVYLWGAQIEKSAEYTVYQRVEDDVYNTAGLPKWLQFDGVDDSLSTAAINFTASTAISSFMGLNKGSSAGVKQFFSTGANPTVSGAFGIYAPNGADLTFAAQFAPVGQGNLSGTTASSYATGQKFTLSAFFDAVDYSLPSNALKVKVNGGSVALTYGGAGAAAASTFGNLPLYVGARESAVIPFTGNMYPLIILGRLATTQEITDTETWVNGKTGAY